MFLHMAAFAIAIYKTPYKTQILEQWKDSFLFETHSQQKAGARILVLEMN